MTRRPCIPSPAHPNLVIHGGARAWCATHGRYLRAHPTERVTLTGGHTLPMLACPDTGRRTPARIHVASLLGGLASLLESAAEAIRDRAGRLIIAKGDQ